MPSNDTTRRLSSTDMPCIRAGDQLVRKVVVKIRV